MKNKTSALSIVFILLAFCCLSCFNSVPAAPTHVMGWIIGGPTSGWTLEEYEWEGYAMGGAPPYTYDWDFDYDGENFDVDVPNDRTPEWTYIVAGEYNEPKEYTVALRVSDGWTWAIDTQVCTIDYTYFLEVAEIDCLQFVDDEQAMTFTVQVKNTGWERSPSYDVDCSIWRRVLGGWEKMADFSDEGPPLGPWPDARFFYFLYVTEEPGYHEFWAQIKVDGVLLDEDYNWFWVTK